MIKKILTILLPVIASNFGSTQVFADEKYPAADFSPSVIYLDESYTASKNKSAQETTKETSKADPAYPAANFTPKVIYFEGKTDSKTPITTKNKPRSDAATFQKETKLSSQDIKTTKKNDDSNLLNFLPLLLVIVVFLLSRKKQTVIDLSVNEKQCQAATEFGTRCRRTFHLEPAILIAHDKAYKLMLCKQHKSHFSKPFVRLN